jgi:UDP-N-acetylmuramoyl-tripeptide--D-alanyl-D-alanine ligase
MRFHSELGEKIAMSGVDVALAFGKRARSSIEAVQRTGTGCAAQHFKDSFGALCALKELVRPGDIILFKGSRSMHVEKVLDGIRNISFSSQT